MKNPLKGRGDKAAGAAVGASLLGAWSAWFGSSVGIAAFGGAVAGTFILPIIGIPLGAVAGIGLVVLCRRLFRRRKRLRHFPT